VLARPRDPGRAASQARLFALREELEAKEAAKLAEEAEAARLDGEAKDAAAAEAAAEAKRKEAAEAKAAEAARVDAEAKAAAEAKREEEEAAAAAEAEAKKIAAFEAAALKRKENAARIAADKAASDAARLAEELAREAKEKEKAEAEAAEQTRLEAEIQAAKAAREEAERLEAEQKKMIEKIAAAKKARMEAQRLKAEKEAADRRVGSAATKLQAANRGRSQRKLLEDKKEEATRLEAEAAEQQRLVEQIAAAKAKRLEASRIKSEKDEADRVLASAAARLQASERGRSQRARDVKKTNETPPDLHHPDPASIRSGDVVRVLLGGLGMEGVVADDHAGTDHTQLAVDFGDGDVEVVPREACALVRPWHALEVGDHAQVKALDSELRSLALVTQIGCDASGLTYVVDYSDGAGEDVEERVHPDRLAKVFTARASAHRHWKKAIHAVRASLIIQKLGAAADSAGEAAAALAAETPPKAAEALMESPMKDSVACTAVHDFSAGGESELGLSFGEKVLVGRAELEKGEDWVYARRVAGHADGFVPSSFLVKTGTKEEEALLNAEGGAASNTTVPEHGTLDLVAARLEAGEVRATSVGDFSAGGDSEMTLAFRESVLVSSDDFASGPDDWVYARRLKTKEDGFVPRSFLVLAGSEEEKDLIENDDGCPVVIPSGELEEGDVRATAVGAFAPDGESEMSLTFGEPLIVRKAELEGGEDWIYAKRLKGREDGFVPRAFLVETGTSAERDALAAGDANGGEETAAVALQAAIRGKAARTKAAMPTRPAPHASAVKLQARLRGRSARKLVAPKRKAPLTKAATKLQARQRGRSARRLVAAKKPKRAAPDAVAATKLQAAIRGRSARKISAGGAAPPPTDAAASSPDAASPTSATSSEALCVAIGDFDGENENEMSLKVGDRVVVKREELDDPDGWLYAKHETEERDGYVPCGYLEVVGAAPDEYEDDFTADKPPEEAAYVDDFEGGDDAGGADYADDFENAAAAAAPVPEDLPEDADDAALAARGLRRCTAVHDFASDGETELGLAFGEHVLCAADEVLAPTWATIKRRGAFKMRCA